MADGMSMSQISQQSCHYKEEQSKEKTAKKNKGKGIHNYAPSFGFINS